MFTPGGALPSIPLSFSLATILPPEPKDFDLSYSADRVVKTSANPESASFMVKTTRVSNPLRSPDFRS